MPGGAALPQGELARVKVDGIAVCVAHTDDGQYRAIADACTHRLASLSDGWLEGHRVECPHHGGMFSIDNGAVLAGPPSLPVAVYDVVVDGDDLLLSIREAGSYQQT